MPLRPYRTDVRPWNGIQHALKDLRESRERIALVTQHDIFGKHRGSFLGRVWSFIMPIVPVSAFVFLRLVVKPAGDADEALIHPAVYVCFGVTLWLLMRDLLMTSISSISKHNNLLSNTGFPLFGAAVTGLGAIAFDTIVRLIFSFCVLLAFGVPDPKGAAVFFGLVAIAGLMAFSVGLLITPVCRIYEDLKLLVEIALRYMIFFSFAIFPIAIEGFGEILYGANPFAIFIVNARTVLLTGEVQDPLALTILVASTPVLLIIGLWSFYAAESAIREGLN